ncbi:MAG: Dihydroorotate dehydrogenase (quinone) [Candidatus Woesearchaeota archaeon]|nr:Dihydroorotate dehydrogenase (quinone) [Candidatus Woesearchaeota archaeon]
MTLYDIIRPVLFRLDAERVHSSVINFAKIIQNNRFLQTPLNKFRYENKRLHTQVYGLHFENPVGLAAGFDKNGEVIEFMHALGFGFIEIGSITAKSCDGNKKPRIFRFLEKEAIVNYMGLNNHGADNIEQTLNSSVKPCPLGISIAKTNDSEITGTRAIEDYIYSIGSLSNHANYMVLNLSCPNAKDGRTFEEPDQLSTLLSSIGSFEVPTLVKLSPNAQKIEKIVDLCQEYNISGFVISNTMSHQKPKGGLSGAPLREASTVLIRRMFEITQGTMPIIGVGGIDSAETAYEKIKAGASLVQLYTGLVYQGPGVVGKINKGLVDLLKKDGYDSISEAVGMTK